MSHPSPEAKRIFSTYSTRMRANVLACGTLNWPNHGVVVVPTETDFIYIMRDDTDYVARTIATRFTNDTSFSHLDRVFPYLTAAYESFLSALYGLQLAALSTSYSTYEVHVFNAQSLEAARRAKSTLAAISLDPMMTSSGVRHLGMSRRYLMGGREQNGWTERPGAAPLADQLRTLATDAIGMPICLFEDDIFSGTTVIDVVKSLKQHGILVEVVVPGIQVGDGAPLDAAGIRCDPVVLYSCSDASNPLSKADLGDPRDYLVGASGLVVTLPSGGVGRVPYILPFVSPHSRASIPKVAEKEFSRGVLSASLVFYAEVMAVLNAPLLVRHCDEHFRQAVAECFDVPPDEPMLDLVDWLLVHMDKLWLQMVEMERVQLEANKRLS